MKTKNISYKFAYRAQDDRMAALFWTKTKSYSFSITHKNKIIGVLPMKKILLTAASAALLLVSHTAAADGAATYKTVCQSCHATGAANAPKLGDKAAWAPRIAKGMDALLQSSIKGIPGTAMMAKGMCAACSNDDLKAAVEYMVSQSK